MRKLLSFLFICLAVFANAKQITSDEAAAIASKFLNSSASAQQAETRINVNRIQPSDVSRSGNENESFYIFNADDNKGFIIIAGDDRLPRVIGYSDKGSFSLENMPPQLSAMLDSLNVAVKRMGDDIPIHKSWLSRATTISEGKVLETAPWGQGAPYNDACPIVDGQRTVAGCGAVAMGIVMKYHNWPEHGVGHHSYYQNGTEIGYDFENAKFDFPKMPDELTENSSSSEIKAVSELLYAAGIAVGTKYGLEGSTFSAGSEALLMGYFLDFIPDCQFIYKDGHNDSEWTDLTVDQIDQGLPVIYSGAPIGISMGHAWVVDGYSSDKSMLHCNFGWNGMSNGYYALNELLGYYYCDGMTINIKPNRDHIPNPGALMKGIHDLAAGNVESGIKITVPEIKSGLKFGLSVKGANFVNLGGLIGKRIALTDADGNLKEVIYESQEGWVVNRYSNNPITPIILDASNLMVKTDNLLPTDKLQLYFKRGENGEWLPVASSLDAKSWCGLSGHNWKTQTYRFHIADGVEVFATHVDPSFKIENGDDITVFDKNGCTIKVSKLEKDPSYRIRFDVNGIHRRNINYMKSDCYVSATYTDDYEASINFGNNTLDTIDVNVEYVRISEPVELKISEAGGLQSLLPKHKAKTVTNLTLSGKINAMDIWYIADEFPILEYLDLSNATIEKCEVEKFPLYIELMSSASKCQAEDMFPEFGIVDMWALKSIKLPTSIKSIGQGALNYCTVLKRLEIPANVEEILTHPNNNKETLYGCTNLEKVVSLSQIPPMVDNNCRIFGNLDDGELYVPEGSQEAYRKANGWSAFKNIYSTGKCYIQLDKTELKLGHHAITTLKAKLIFPGEASDVLHWSSSEPDIVEIHEVNNDKQCFVWAKENGTAIITVSTQIGDKTFIAKCAVTVMDIPSNYGIGIQDLNRVVPVGTSVKVQSWVTPDADENHFILWSSSNEDVATIDSKGVLTAIAEGKTKVRAAANFYPNLWAEIEVTVIGSSGVDYIDDQSNQVRVIGRDIIVPEGSVIYDIYGPERWQS